MSEFNAHLESLDFEGAEELLDQNVGAQPRYAPFFHFQYGRLYARWNKLTSALNHLHKATELAATADDEILLVQIVEEIRSVKNRQLLQQP